MEHSDQSVIKKKRSKPLAENELAMAELGEVKEELSPGTNEHLAELKAEVKNAAKKKSSSSSSKLKKMSGDHSEAKLSVTKKPKKKHKKKSKQEVEEAKPPSDRPQPAPPESIVEVETSRSSSNLLDPDDEEEEEEESLRLQTGQKVGDEVIEPKRLGPMILSEKSYPLLEGSLVPSFPASQTVSQIYLQDANGFSKTSRRKMVKLSVINQIQPLPAKESSSISPLDLGLASQKIFRSIGVFCHGFLAGLACWQIIMVHILSENMDVVQIMATYSPMSQPMHLLFYFLTMVCTVSVLDRYDLAQCQWRQLHRMFTFRSGGLSMLVYLVALLLTLLTTNIDDKLSLYQFNATLFENCTIAELEQEMLTWKALNFCRCFGVILGWFLVSMRPSTDLLYKHLRRLTDFQANIQAKCGLP